LVQPWTNFGNASQNSGRGSLNPIFTISQLSQTRREYTKGQILDKRPKRLLSVQGADRGKTAKATGRGTGGNNTPGGSAGSPEEAAIDMRLFRIPLREVEPGRHYEVRFKRQRKWKLAFRWEKLWLANGDLVGRVEDTAEVRASEQEVKTAIDVVAETMARPWDDGDTPALRQHYIDKVVHEFGDTLLGGNSPSPDHPSEQKIAVFQAIRLAAAAKAIPSVPYSEIAVGYRVTDKAGNTVFETPVVEEAVLFAKDHRINRRKGVAVVFADGSVRYEHEIFLLSWLRPWYK